MKAARKTKVLAIDPGTREMGIALLENGEPVYHAVKTIRKRASPQKQLQEAQRIVARLLRDFRPTVVVAEKTFVARNRSAALLNVLFDEIRATVRRRGIPFASLASSTVKKVIAGNGQATKEEVAKVIVTKYPELKVYLSQDRKWKQRYHENMFDAVALGLAFLTLRATKHEAGLPATH